MHPPGVAALERWGLLERLEATGCPPVETYSFDFGPLTIAGSPRPIDGIARGYCPRRTVLDQLLVDAAVEAGAELREGFTVDEILADEGDGDGHPRSRQGRHGAHRARAGRDRRRRQALPGREDGSSPSSTTSGGRSLAMYYAYWSDLPAAASTPRSGPRIAVAGRPSPTHDDLTVLPFGWPVEEFKANREDIEGNFFAAMDHAPEFAERVRAAKRESKFIGSAELPGYFRKPFGPGWALLGDAGYHKNPITAMGINDAFRDAELVAGALDDCLLGEALVRGRR